MELEALYEEHKLNKEQRIKYLGELQEKLLNELKNRDLSDVKSDKLLEMLLKTNEKLDNIQTTFNPRVRTEEEIQKQKIRDENHYSQTYFYKPL